MLKTIGIIIVVIALAATGFMFYAGFFYPVKISEAQAGPFTLVYKKATGSYSKSYTVINEVYKSLATDNIKTAKCFGIYFDNPRTVPEQNLRYIAGCIIEGEYKTGSADKGIFVKNFAPAKCVTTEFPFKNKLNIFAGVMKVYPKLAEYSQQKAYPMNAVMEIYDNSNKKITYYLPVENGAFLDLL
jgi:DNA gyrase inhibitor GyrI